MSIVGIGTDVVEIARIRTIFEKFPHRFAQRILSSAEQKDLLQYQDKVAFIARRFAAKEAAVKALGTGFTEGIFLTDIAVKHTTLGQPVLVFSGKALEAIQQQQIQRTFLSISDEKSVAVAFVVYEQ